MENEKIIDWNDIMDKYLKETREPFSAPDQNTFRASSLGCVRQCVRSRLGISEPDLEGLRIMQIGTNLHRFIQTELVLGFLPKPVEFEKKIKFEVDGITFTGHVDCWDGEYIYDFKTTSNVERSIEYPTSMAYLMQLSVYTEALKAKGAYLVYVDKSTYKMLTKKVEPMEIGKIVDFCKSVQQGVDEYNATGMLPEKCTVKLKYGGCFVCKYKDNGDL